MSARIQVAQARTALDETVLRAPVAGTIAVVNGTVGTSSASTGSGADSTTSTSNGFVSITSLDSLQVKAYVAEADINDVELGQDVTVTFSAKNTSVQGVVSAIDTQDTVTNNVVTYGVTVTVIDPPATLKIGQTASISIITATKSGVLVAQSSAITTVGGTSTVTVRKDGKDTVQTVTTGIVGDTGTEILTGVVAGDVLVVPTSAGGAGGFTFPGGGPPGGLGGGLGGTP